MGGWVGVKEARAFYYYFNKKKYMVVPLPTDLDTQPASAAAWAAAPLLPPHARAPIEALACVGNSPQPSRSYVDSPFSAILA